jgi:hypothetical protein
LIPPFIHRSILEDLEASAAELSESHGKNETLAKLCETIDEDRGWASRFKGGIASSEIGVHMGIGLNGPDINLFTY